MDRTVARIYVDDEGVTTPLPDNTDYLARNGIIRTGSPAAERLGETFRAKLEAGERIYLLGFLATSHNSGIALVEATSRHGIEVIVNLEEERFSQIKHFAGYPAGAVQELKRLMNRLGLRPDDILAVCYGFDVIHEEQSARRMRMNCGDIVENTYFRFITEGVLPTIEFGPDEFDCVRKSTFSHSPALAAVFRRLVNDLDLAARTACVQMLHHESHAFLAYGASPFAGGEYGDKPTMIACIDGAGDLSSVSLFEARNDSVVLIKRNARVDSLGIFYMLCSSLLGGWAPLRAESRYMGATAWGNGDRLTNPFYKRLRQFFHFGAAGELHVNAAMAADEFRRLEEVVGPFVGIDDIWNPDAVINVDDIRHSPITRERVDAASAVQMVFEDGLVHIVSDLIDRTRADQLVLCGGTALNCVANMRLIEAFDESYYLRYLGQRTRLKLWVPPIPSDQGVVAGAAYQFAMLNGAKARGEFATPFLCGLPPTLGEIESALREAEFVECETLGNINDAATIGALADWMAYLVAGDGVIGVYDGAAETGPRALGHRSLLSNPCNPDTLELLNSRVKYRERIRPLAPMVTLSEAQNLFDLSPGAAAAGYDAYNYMVLTVRAKDVARTRIPAVVHHDGTSRIQIVRASGNALMFRYLKALKPRIGVEVSVNTSMNVGSPIVQTPQQALEVLRRAQGIDCIFMIGDEGVAYMVWSPSGRGRDIRELQRLYHRERQVHPGSRAETMMRSG